MTIVVDASVLVAALLDTGAEGRWAEAIIARGDLTAPELILVESTNILRRLERAGQISNIAADMSRRALMRLELTLLPFAPFADRIWELRHNVTSYDAWYVAIAERIPCELATLDRKLAIGTGPTCVFTLPP